MQPTVPMRKSSEGEARSFSPFVLACFSLNYILGTGFLSLPWAFGEAGLALSAVAMACICAIAYLSSEYLLTTMARAHHVLQVQGAVEPQEGQQQQQIHEETEYGALLVPLEQQLQSPPAEDEHERLVVGARRIDIPELTHIFLGATGFKIYSICVSVYLYGAQWSFTSVFGSALSSTWPHFSLLGIVESNSSTANDSYPLYVGLYACIVVPMSCLELHEQKMIQIILTISRLVMMFLMIITPLLAAASPSAPQFGDPHSASFFPAEDVPLMHWSGIHNTLPVMVFAAIFHFSIPSLAEQMTHGECKRQIHKVFVWAFVLVGTLYSCIGMVDAWYFGSHIAQSANVHWAEYQSSGTITSWVAMAVSFFVVMFPAINVISTFPLHALILGDCLMSIVYGSKMEEMKKQNRCITIAFRILAAVPPIFLGLSVRELGRITGYTGLMGLAIAFGFPPLLYLTSYEKAKRLGISTLSQYETFRWKPSSSLSVARAMLIFGVASICFVLSSFLSSPQQ